MEETSRSLLDLLRSDDRTAWIADHLTSSYAEGLSQSAKEAGALVQTEFVDVQSLSSKEKAKREKYETSRPYTEAEKLELAQFALEQVFLALPAMQEATIERLRDLGSVATSIEFLQPDEEERIEGSYARSFQASHDQREQRRHRLSVFLEKLRT